MISSHDSSVVLSCKCVYRVSSPCWWCFSSCPVIGALIGKQEGRNIEVMNSFELLSHTVDDRAHIDKEYYYTKEEQCKWFVCGVCTPASMSVLFFQTSMFLLRLWSSSDREHVSEKHLKKKDLVLPTQTLLGQLFTQWHFYWPHPGAFFSSFSPFTFQSELATLTPLSVISPTGFSLD